MTIEYRATSKAHVPFIRSVIIHKAYRTKTASKRDQHPHVQNWILSRGETFLVDFTTIAYNPSFEVLCGDQITTLKKHYLKSKKQQHRKPRRLGWGRRGGGGTHA